MSADAWETPEQAAARLARVDADGPWSDGDTILFAIRDRDAKWKAALEAEANRQGDASDAENDDPEGDPVRVREMYAASKALHDIARRLGGAS